MITVKIAENNGLIALCTITGESEEFRRDLALIKSVPFEDREFVGEAEPKYWRIRHAERYANLIDEIKVAINIHKMQLKMF